jgi:hypothetical protein
VVCFGFLVVLVTVVSWPVTLVDGVGTLSAVPVVKVSPVAASSAYKRAFIWSVDS